MNYYQFHIGDYASHTAHLSPLEDIAYRRMLDVYYRTQCPLPNDVQRISKLIRMPDDAATVRDILNEFFTLSEQGWSNARAEREIQSYKRMADGGAKGAAKRWGKPPHAHPMPTPCPPQANPNSNHEPITNNQEPIEKPTKASAPVGLDFRFERFWKAYPKKVGKDQARKAFDKRKPNEELLTNMLQALEWQTQSESWTKDGGQFIPNPATWLNQGRWKDEKPEGSFDDWRNNPIFAGGI